MVYPPKYSIIELGELLDKEPALPSHIDEDIFERHLKNNGALRWRINPFLFDRQLYKVLLNKKDQRHLKQLNLLNWLIVILIPAFSIWTNDYIILVLLLIYPFFLNSGLLDHKVVLINSIILLALEFIFKFHNHYFAAAFLVFISGYVISRLKFEILQKSIFQKAFADFRSFCKYYFNRLVYIDKTTLNTDARELFERYPELDI